MAFDALSIRNAFVRVAFGAGGLPFGYQLIGSSLTGSNERFGAASDGELPTARVCRLSPRAYADVALKPVRVAAGYSVMSFDFEVMLEGREAARFTLRYQLDRAQLKVTLQDVSECEGHELIQVTLPTLCSLAGGGRNWLAHCKHGGSVQAIADAAPGELPEHPYFGRILHILPLLMLGTEGAVCTMEVTASNIFRGNSVLIKVDKHTDSGIVQLHYQSYPLSRNGTVNVNVPNDSILHGERIEIIAYRNGVTQHQLARQFVQPMILTFPP